MSHLVSIEQCGTMPDSVPLSAFLNILLVVQLLVILYLLQVKYVKMKLLCACTVFRATLIGSHTWKKIKSYIFFAFINNA